MNRKSKLTVLIASLGVGLLAGTMVAGPASAEELVASSAPVLVAEAPAAPAKEIRANVVGIDLAPGAIAVSGHDGKKVTVSTAGQKARSITPKSKTAAATFTKLTPGKTYTVAVGGQAVAKTTVLAAPGQTSNMKVRTTNDPGSVLMTWDYTPAKNTGTVSFRLTATPVIGQDDQTQVSMDVPGTEREAILTGLNPSTLYKFSVTAVNDAAAGKDASAVMTRTLGDLTGADEAAVKAAQQAADQAAADEAARKAAQDAAAQQPTAPAGGGGGPSAPAMRTVYFCNEGTLNGSSCDLTRAYTFHTETETQAYTYTWTKVGTRRNTTNEHCDYLPDGNGGLNIYCTGAYDEDVYDNVKNGTPAGFTDNGSAWVRDVQVKDATPAGWSDSGSAWTKSVQASSRQEAA